MTGAIYETGSAGIWSFVVVTLILGGLSAYITGRALAQTWRPILQLIGYVMLLGCLVRFIQFVLFEARLLSVSSYVVDTLVLLAITFAGYQMTRRSQMRAQYGWLDQRR